MEKRLGATLRSYRVKHDEHFSLFFLEKPVELLRVVEKDDVGGAVLFFPRDVCKAFEKVRNEIQGNGCGPIRRVWD